MSEQDDRKQQMQMCTMQHIPTSPKLSIKLCKDEVSCRVSVCSDECAVTMQTSNFHFFSGKSLTFCERLKYLEERRYVVFTVNY